MRTVDALWRHLWLSELQGGYYWHLVGSGRDAAEHLIMHRTAPTTRKYQVQNVNSVRLRNPFLDNKARRNIKYDFLERQKGQWKVINEPSVILICPSPLISDT